MPKYKLLSVSLALNVVAVLTCLWAVHKLGGPRYLAHRLHTLDAWPTYTQRVSQLKLLPAAGSGLLFLGDSHVAYGEWGEWLPGHRTYNRGVPAEATARLYRAPYFRKTVGDATDTVVLQVGTNDLLFGNEPAREYLDLVDALGLICETVYVCTLPGVNNEVRWTGIDPSDIVAFNAFLRDRVGGRPNVTVIDLAAALGTRDGILPPHLTDDGVHLRGEGYQIWVKELEAILARGTTLAE